MLMSATIQFLGVSWIEYMKGTYRLRKAYKMYEHLFETVEGQKTSDYASILRKQKLKRRPQRRHAWGNSEIKRFSFFAMPTRKASVDHQRSSLRRRSFSSAIEESSTAIGIADLESESNVKNKNNTLQSGIFFGIGLFSLIFSLLPPKVNRILNTLGFHSSRPFALNVLQKSYESNGLYSSLSALTLLIYYTNLTLFIHPRLSPCSISPESARRMLTDMKVRYPNNKIWELLDGKLCKMEGKPRRGVEILRDSRRRRVDLSGRLTSKLRSNCFSLSELGQVQALAVYEMGWGQIFLGDYFQASETFFRLESINNWSRAFYHYIATCCMFANEQYDKASMEFHQIPNILERKRQLGGRLLPNEAFAERKIRRWREKAQRIAIETSQHTSISQHQGKDRSSFLDGHILKHVVEVNPLWELIYLWNGIPQLAEEMLNGMKECLEQCLLRQVSTSDKAILHLLFGTVMRELGDFEQAEKNLQAVLDRELEVVEDRWTIPYAMYELAALRCFCLLQQDRIGSQNISDIEDLVRRSEQYFSQRRGSNSGNNSNGNEIPYETSVVEDTHDWDSRLHIRCQLLLEKLDELKTNL
ncbi:hypothetical protein BX666DRAFT_1995478 [Dichotomocladium elegans]|nr:hypothetical protein BX666DRAFT_1995478 [Dichotomocladium elegans]